MTAAGILLALAVSAQSAHEAHADLPLAAPPARPTFRLEYRRLDEQSARTCPNEQSARKLADHIFGYAVVDDGAKFAISLDVTISHQPSRYEVVSHILDGDQISRMTRIHSVKGSEPDHCLQAVYQSLTVIADLGAPRLEELQALPALGPTLTTKAPPSEKREEEPVKPPPPAPTPSITVTLPPSTPAWRRPQGFMLTAGLTTSVGLMPTPSLGGLIGVSYRLGAWSGGLEGRVEHGLVPADLQALPVDSLYAGAALLAPCVHEGAFSGCFVLDGGGYSFSLGKDASEITGRFAMFGFGLRANLEHRVGEHFLLRSFVQISALPVNPSIDVVDGHKHLWNSGPGFGTLGLTFVSLP